MLFRSEDGIKQERAKIKQTEAQLKQAEAQLEHTASQLAQLEQERHDAIFILVNSLKNAEVSPQQIIATLEKQYHLTKEQAETYIDSDKIKQ